MTWSSARIMLLATGALFLLATAMGLVPPLVAAAASIGVSIGGGLLLWHALLGSIAFAVGLLSPRPSTASAVSHWLIAICIVYGALVLAAAQRFGFTLFDALAPFFVAALLWAGIRASKPTPVRGWERPRAG